MYDDGNYATHGDDMAGDGVYSVNYLSMATDDSVFSFGAKNGTDESNSVDVKFYTPISDETLEIIEAVDKKIDEVILSDEFLGATEEKQKELVVATLTNLALTGMIEGDSILFNEEAGVYSFQYVDGIQGGVVGDKKIWRISYEHYKF